MAVIAYTSSAINPLVTQVDKVVDMAATPLPVTVQLYGDGKEDGDPGAVWTYAWEVIDKPTGSLARFQDTLGQTSTLQNPIVENVDTWGNINVFLVVTNTNTANSSSADFLTLDTVKAKTVVRVKSVAASIQKMAAYEWSWHSHLRVWADVIEAMKAAVLTLPAEVLQLISTGYAELPPGTSLHLHKGEDVDVGTTTVRGTLLVSDAPADPVNPVALNVDYRPQSVLVTHTPTTAGLIPGIEVADPTIGAAKYPHALFHIRQACVMEGFSVHFADFGDLANVYEFEVYYGPSADWYSGAALSKFLPYDVTLGPGVAANQTLGTYSADDALALAIDDIVGVFVKTAPTSLFGAAVPGANMTVTAHLYRKV